LWLSPAFQLLHQELGTFMGTCHQVCSLSKRECAYPLMRYANQFTLWREIPVLVHREKMFQDDWNRHQATMPKANQSNNNTESLSLQQGQSTGFPMTICQKNFRSCVRRFPKTRRQWSKVNSIHITPIRQY
jgi:hypothetical protein